MINDYSCIPQLHNNCSMLKQTPLIPHFIQYFYHNCKKTAVFLCIHRYLHCDLVDADFNFDRIGTRVVVSKIMILNFI